MQVWIGFKQNEDYVHEWTGEVACGEGYWKCLSGLSEQER
jgi:hypothetical protein